MDLTVKKQKLEEEFNRLKGEIESGEKEIKRIQTIITNIKTRMQELRGQWQLVEEIELEENMTLFMSDSNVTPDMDLDDELSKKRKEKDKKGDK